MANNWFYDMIVPSFTDPTMRSGVPGFRLEIVERDGGIGIGLSTGSSPEDGFRMAFINAEDAQDVVEALQKAIALATPKPGAPPWHPRRARNP